MGGLLTLPSFTRVFPEIDTTKKGLEGLTQAEANHRSTIQGRLPFLFIVLKRHI